MYALSKTCLKSVDAGGLWQWRSWWKSCTNKGCRWRVLSSTNRASNIWAMSWLVHSDKDVAATFNNDVTANSGTAKDSQAISSASHVVGNSCYRHMPTSTVEQKLRTHKVGINEAHHLCFRIVSKCINGAHNPRIHTLDRKIAPLGAYASSNWLVMTTYNYCLLVPLHCSTAWFVVYYLLLHTNYRWQNYVTLAKSGCMRKLKCSHNWKEGWIFCAKILDLNSIQIHSII